MDIGTTLNISIIVLFSVSRSHVAELRGQLLWPVSSPPVCGLSGCQKVKFWHKYPLWGFRHGFMWLENDSPVKTFFSQNTTNISKERPTLLDLILSTGHTSLLAMMHPELWCIRESSVIAVLSEMLFVHSSKIRIVPGLYFSLF